MQSQRQWRKSTVLAILAADQQADLSQLASHKADYALRWPARRKSMNSQAVLRRDPPFQLPSKTQTGCRPPLFERFDEIAFNAGMLDKSVI